MYFKDFPQYLYDFNYGNRVKTSVVVDITRNIRFRKEVLQNVTLYDEYDVVDGETPEIISEKFYGTPEYHWVIMLANGKYDYRFDFPMIEPVLQKHIADVYNPTLYSTDWYWKTENDQVIFYIKITSVEVPFDGDYLTAPVKITLENKESGFKHVINFPNDPIGFSGVTQYFFFPYNMNEFDLTKIGTGTLTEGVGKVQITVNTEGREHNPVYFVNQLGNVVNPSENAIPVTGDVLQRLTNDAKRRIKIISPTLLETIIRNYEDEL